MIPHQSLLVSSVPRVRKADLILLVDKIPLPEPPEKRGRGRPKVYPDRLYLLALMVMISRHLHKVHELLSVLEQPTQKMQQLRTLFTP